MCARRKERNGNARADSHPDDTVAEAFDRAGDLRSWDSRKIGCHRVAVLAHQRLSEIDPGGADANQHLAGPRSWSRLLNDLEDFGSAEAAELDGSHYLPFGLGRW